MYESKYFNIGKLVSTRKVHDLMETNSLFALEVMQSLEKYSNKDWGDIEEGDKKLNDEALKNPDDIYLLAAYTTCKGKIWIITERVSEKPGDNATTVLFPEER